MIITLAADPKTRRRQRRLSRDIHSPELADRVVIGRLLDPPAGENAARRAGDDQHHHHPRMVLLAARSALVDREFQTGFGIQRSPLNNINWMI